MNRIWKAIRWGMITGGMMYMGYIGITEEVPWAWNLYRFMFWLTIVITFFVMASKDQQKSLAARGRSVPMTIDLATDLAQIAFLAAMGHFWMAGFWTFHTGVYNAVFEKTLESLKEEKCAEPSPSQQA